MDIETLKSAFSKGFITLGSDYITIIYPYYTNTRGWYSQEISDENKELLSILLQYSNRIDIVTEPSKFVEIVFYGKFNVDKMYFYPPTEHELTTEEINKIRESIFSNSPYNLEEIFKNIDSSSDDEEIRQTFDDWVDRVLPPDKPLSYQNVVRLQDMVDILYELPQSDKYTAKVSQTSGDMSGFIELYINEGESISIIGDEKYVLSDMVDASSLFVFEMNVKDGFCNAVFFVD